jgi:TorA maturation chaperone TorD
MSGPAVGTNPLHQVRASLAAAALWRAVSSLFAPPAVQSEEQLVALASELVAEDAEAVLLATRARQAGGEPAYHRLLGAGGHCPTGETDHAVNVLGAKGGVLGDVAGFYQAFEFDPAAEMHESPDHVAIETSFVAWLHLKEASAWQRDRREDAATIARARATFLIEHLRPLLTALRRRLAGLEGDALAAALARVLALPALEQDALAAGLEV